jgi:hypothetical protein
MSFVRMMVSSGLAGAHVQPCPRKIIELRATSFELGAIGFWFAHGSILVAQRIELREKLSVKTGPVAQVARAHP